MTISKDNESSIPKVILAGGLGGGCADMIMHPLDTLKTRLQGQPYPPTYNSLPHAFRTIIKLEGVRGLYGGLTPALIGSVGGSMIYFGSYELLKRQFNLLKLEGSMNHLISGGLAELLVSVIYVPTEVLKTRIQLQGKYNNPHFNSGYNYFNWFNAFKTIVKNDGLFAMFKGYRATLLRDVPCTAIQFAIYEKLKSTVNKNEISIPMDMLMGGIAGSIAGGITTPLDVVKTLLQTQLSPKPKTLTRQPLTIPHSSSSKKLRLPKVPTLPSTLSQSVLSLDKLPKGVKRMPYATGIVDGLLKSYQTFGFSGLIKGLVPRTVWTGCQSAIMFVVYETVLDKLG